MAGHEQQLDDDELITGEAVALDLRPANFILRAAGALIDWFIIIAVYIGLILVLTSPLASVLIDASIFPAVSIAALVFCVVVIPTTVETLTQGRSLGKLAIGARIVRDDGGAIGFRHAFIRALLAVFEIMMTLGGLAAVVALLNSRSKRLGDMLAGTYSQHERVSRIETPVYGVPQELSEWAATADVARMPAGLSRRISQFLSQAGAQSPTARRHLATELAREAARYVSPLPSCEAETFLAAVAAVRRDREYRALLGAQQRLSPLEPVLHGLPHGFPER